MSSLPPPFLLLLLLLLLVLPAMRWRSSCSKQLRPTALPLLIWRQEQIALDLSLSPAAAATHSPPAIVL
jgi:hypothetical protein